MYWCHSANGLHPDFGTLYNGIPNGIPVNYVGNATARRQVTYYEPDYHNESDPMPPEGFPIPDGVKIEGDGRLRGDPTLGEGDHHILLIDTDARVFHEFFSIRVNDDGSHSTNAYARFPMDSTQMRPMYGGDADNGTTSADAAGNPMAVLLVRYEEILEGEIKHALRFCLDNIWGYQWPGTHKGYSGDDRGPWYGMRVRIKADVDVEGNYPDDPNLPISETNKIILRAMKRYGMFLSDAGGNWFFSGCPDPRWDDEDLHNLSRFEASECFEIVDQSGMMIAPDSMQAKQL